MSDGINDLIASQSWPSTWYDMNCRDCPRLSGFLDQVKIESPSYFCRPVPPFGDRNAQLLIVGLAPGKHGANATGRPFTGDFAGGLLYQTLNKFGYASAPISNYADDDLELKNCRITNAVKCLPPQNKPVGDEEKTCNHFLTAEMSEPSLRVILALGLLAHRSILRSFGYKLNAHPFGHNRVHVLENSITLVDSYHCSRYNTQTKRLTTEMFKDVFKTIQTVVRSD
jgi:uracil-DNA glycosylase family 4